MIIDNVKIRVTAGKGGPGAVAFSHVKMNLGPTGGNGGDGGSVWLEAVADLGALRHFKAKKVFVAEDGIPGKGALRDGQDGKDLILTVPRGTVVHNLTTGEEHELIRVGERYQVAEGGNGGKGNYLFRSSINTSPKQFQPGLPGEEAEIELELKLIADIGLIGLPNIGKSSFLNELTNAQSRVANYPFTTLEPHLGVYHSLVLADIPGLIEGASQGKGLGIKFLRHIERTKILFHFIESTNEDPVKAYKAIRKELKTYNPALLEKEEYIVISKSDLVDEKRIKEIMKALKKEKKTIMPISIYNYEQMNEMRRVLDGVEREVQGIGI